MKETRERIIAAMAALNYHPNALARSLRQGRANIIGLVFPDSTNPFFAEISRSIEGETFKKGYIAFLYNTEKDIATQSVNLLVDRMSQKNHSPSRLALPSELIVRRSTQQVR